jgi:putative ABC transport system permease protein
MFEREGWDRSLSNLYRFLGLVGFMSLLLGSLGVASSIHVYVRQRIQTVAVLRCYGASSRQTIIIYLIQALGMGLVGVVLGSAVGVSIQSLLPLVLGDFLPVDVDFAVSWPSVLLGSGIGLGVTLLFALMPLLEIRNIPPLAAIRADFSHEPSKKESRSRWILFGIISILVSLFAVVQAPTIWIGLGYAVSVAVVFILLSITARLIMRFMAAKPPKSVSYVVKQGIANLHRPHNQTLMMILALGFGSFLVSTMLLSERTLLNQIDLASTEGRPNLVFYDVQPAQVDSVESLIQAANLPVIDQVAMISMRISSINGRGIEEIREDSTLDYSWAHRREYRSTYRDFLSESETVVSGAFDPVYEGSGRVPISVEQDVASQLGVEVGDSLGFNIQGVQFDTRISSIREVDWRQMQTNFFFVFPEGAINDAPAFHVVMSRTETEAESAAIQAEVVQSFTNVSSIDVSVVLSVFEAIFSRISFVVRFMALFSILTGLLVLSGAVLISRFQRIEESVLLKTLGASRKTVLRIMSVEYLVLGLAGAVTGVGLSLISGWAIAYFVFDSSLVVPFVPLAGIVFAVVVLTLIVGQLNSRGIYEKEALEVLRKET